MLETTVQTISIGQQTGGRVFLFLRTDDFWRDYHHMKSQHIYFVREPQVESYGTVAGLDHGLWCFGSGWALMLFPMLLPAGHNLAMLAVTVLMISEHLEHPKTPRWRFNFSGKLLRGLYAQTGIRMQQLLVRA